MKLTSACYYISTVFMLNALSAHAKESLTYPIVDTNQTTCIGLNQPLSVCPSSGDRTFGQDAQYQGLTPSYTDNNNLTITDDITQLMWSKTTDINGDGKINAKDKLTYEQALDYAGTSTLAGHNDWRIPTIKELYSLIQFDGQDPSGPISKGELELIPFINQHYFDFNAGDTEAGERLIDSQYLSSTRYVSSTMHGDDTVFGVNFIDGRIKGYGISMPNGKTKSFYVITVRGNSDYGKNELVNNNNSTVSDKATGLIWQQRDSGAGMDFPTALAYCEQLNLAGQTDWRLPNVKELHSIVDYSKSPKTSHSATIDSLFSSTRINNEAGESDYASYWSSTTHNNLQSGRNAAYVSFGQSLGNMRGQWIDVHGAGSQRSDPKVGDSSQYPTGHGPQGDAIRIDNLVRCVSGGVSNFVQQPISNLRKPMTLSITTTQSSMQPQPNQNQPKLQNDPFSNMDRNGDGKLSKQEAKGPLAKDFKRIDRDGDGYITRQELPKRG
ncbi:DUF1566 domain-containing protein [Aliivibrio kagoshimensis]|uniref:Lcl C-terminal domain-containing protein n=1 Tax=Aliivibrio kagoshimensis TaxID=2910230 RepID=UPI003D0FEAD2